MKDVVVISKNKEMIHQIEEMLAASYKTVVFPNALLALNHIYESLPDLLVVDLREEDERPGILLKNNLKEEPLFGQIPILAILSRSSETPDWDEVPLDDYIREHNLAEELPARVRLSLARSRRMVETNPLTRLPGNISILRKIHDLLASGQIFALAYADLNNFKPYNDKYGFGRGDEVLKATGRIILNVVRSVQPQDSFVGHVGGDDYVFIVQPELVEAISAEIIKSFDSFIPIMYEPNDRQASGIVALDRQGRVCFFPLLSIAIGITDNSKNQFHHYGQMVETATQMKQFAKKKGGSFYCLDKRKNEVP